MVMATHNKKTTKASKNAKSATGSKKTLPAKAMSKAPAKKAAVPAKKATAAKPTSKPAAKTPAKKTVKPVAKKAPVAKKVTPIKITKNNQTVNKKNSKTVAPVKKTSSAKKETAKKVAPPKKAETAKKAATKPAAKPAAKPVAKAAAKPAPKPAVKAATKTAPAPVAKKAAPAQVAAKTGLPLRKADPKLNMPPAPKPTPTPAARSIEKKPTVIIAHRRLENKSKSGKEMPSIASYQTETYRSILDEPKPESGPVYRYSDEELGEFRELVTSRLDAARKELNYLQGLITRKDEAGTEDTENRYMNMEDGSGAMEREQLAQLASRQIQFMNHLEKALVRIENKTYGICRVTGKLIDKARLRAVPHATLSIEAKKLMGSKQAQ
jgi:RNA polymerase-binding transcription factor DksA